MRPSSASPLRAAGEALVDNAEPNNARNRHSIDLHVSPINRVKALEGRVVEMKNPTISMRQEFREKDTSLLNHRTDVSQGYNIALREKTKVMRLEARLKKAAEYRRKLEQEHRKEVARLKGIVQDNKDKMKEQREQIRRLHREKKSTLKSQKHEKTDQITQVFGTAHDIQAKANEALANKLMKELCGNIDNSTSGTANIKSSRLNESSEDIKIIVEELCDSDSDVVMEKRQRRVSLIPLITVKQRIETRGLRKLRALVRWVIFCMRIRKAAMMSRKLRKREILQDFNEFYKVFILLGSRWIMPALRRAVTSILMDYSMDLNIPAHEVKEAPHTIKRRAMRIEIRVTAICKGLLQLAHAQTVDLMMPRQLQNFVATFLLREDTYFPRGFLLAFEKQHLHLLPDGALSKMNTHRRRMLVITFFVLKLAVLAIQKPWKIGLGRRIQGFRVRNLKTIATMLYRSAMTAIKSDVGPTIEDNRYISENIHPLGHRIHRFDHSLLHTNARRLLEFADCIIKRYGTRQAIQLDRIQVDRDRKAGRIPTLLLHKGEISDIEWWRKKGEEEVEQDIAVENRTVLQHVTGFLSPLQSIKIDKKRFRSPGIRTRHFTFEDERGSLAPAHTVMHSGVESNDNLSENSRAEDIPRTFISRIDHRCAILPESSPKKQNVGSYSTEGLEDIGEIVEEVAIDSLRSAQRDAKAIPGAVAHKKKENNTLCTVRADDCLNKDIC